MIREQEPVGRRCCMRRAYVAVLLLISFAAVVPLCAQLANSADLSVVVLDENGAPLAGAQVKLEDAAGHTQTALSDPAGHFTFRSLVPGDYHAEARKEGFFVLAGQSFVLHAGNNTLSLILNHEQEIHDQVQVTVPVHAIDAQDAVQHSELSAQEIRDIPVASPHVLQQSLV